MGKKRGMRGSGVRGCQRVKSGVVLRGNICGEVGKKRGEIAGRLPKINIIVV